MKTVEEDFKNLKSKLFDNIKTRSDTEVMSSIVKVKDMDEDMQELIILLYSNYKVELESIKQDNLETTTTLIDLNLRSLNRLKIQIDANARNRYTPPEEREKITKGHLRDHDHGFFKMFASLPNTSKIALTLTFTLSMLVLLSVAAPTATDKVMGFFENLVSNNSNIIKE